MKEIKRPDWYKDFVTMSETSQTDGRSWTGVPIQYLDKWFSEYEGKCYYDPNDAVEVRGYLKPTEFVGDGHWYMGNDPVESGELDTHKALLINIEPIKQESCADVLRDLYNDAKSAKLQFMHNYEKRITDALERSND